MPGASKYAGKVTGSTIMLEFLKFVVGQLVDRPGDMNLVEEERGGDVHFTVSLPPSEVGKVIGKQGHTIQAIRSLLAAPAARQGKRVFLEINEQPS